MPYIIKFKKGGVFGFKFHYQLLPKEDYFIDMVDDPIEYRISVKIVKIINLLVEINMKSY